MAVLTDATYASGTNEEKLAYWEALLPQGRVQSVSARGKTVTYDTDFIQKQIDSFRRLVHRGDRVVHTRHARR